jgi:hypothetical protein
MQNDCMTIIHGGNEKVIGIGAGRVLAGVFRFTRKRGIYAHNRPENAPQKGRDRTSATFFL